MRVRKEIAVAFLRLDLLIDSELYPELYAKLASIATTTGREEKLRQLAATGLLWELARLHGPALLDLGEQTPPRVPQPAAPSRELARPGPVVDLGLDAPRAPAEVPVLLDVVSAAEMQEVPAVTVAMVVPLHEEDVESELLQEAHEEEPPPAPVVHSSSAKERLKRMRDRGLFQNG